MGPVRDNFSGQGKECQMTKLSVGLQEAESMTGISQHTFRKLVKRGKVRVARIGRRIVIPITELEKLVKPGAKLESQSHPPRKSAA
jgi:excisionase family DNA binding protein